MNDYTTPPRRPIPGPSGIAAKAVALREQSRLPEAAYNAQSEKTVTEMAPQGPTIQEALQAGHAAWRAGTQPAVGNLAKGIAGVMSEVGTIAKSGYNKFHGYHYATLQDLLYAITPLMGKNGVVVMQNEKERSALEGGRVQVTYEFSIFHTSGEIWPEKPRFTGMAIGKTSKGEWDDKVINKCHSAARKYFLLSLFQVPSGDFDDADEGSSQKVPPQSAERTRGPVPGPGPRPEKRPEKPEPMAPPPLTIEERDYLPPQKIGLGAGAGALSWAQKFIDCINVAKSEDELAAWDELNAGVLNKLEEEHPDLDMLIAKAVTKRTLVVAPLLAMPDAKNDTQAAMQWVAQQLVDAETYEQAEDFWNKAVAPHEREFDPADWDLLLNEWRRLELRLNPEPPEPEPPEAA